MSAYPASYVSGILSPRVPKHKDGDSLDREPSLTNHPRCTTRRKKTDILLNQTFGQVKQSSLVIDGKNSYYQNQQDQISSKTPRPPSNYSGKDIAPTGLLLRHDVDCKSYQRVVQCNRHQEIINWRLQSKHIPESKQPYSAGQLEVKKRNISVPPRGFDAAIGRGKVTVT